MFPPERKVRIAGFASHNGSMLQAVQAAIEAGILSAEIKLIISNNSTAPVLEYAKQKGLDGRHMSTRTEGGPHQLDQAMCLALGEKLIELIILSGWMKKVGPRVVRAYPKRIINTHPAPRGIGFDGDGMYGDAVHLAVLAAGVKETGVTFHYVDDPEKYDVGELILFKPVPVLDSDKLEPLRARVQDMEKVAIIEVLQKIIPAFWAARF